MRLSPLHPALLLIPVLLLGGAELTHGDDRQRNYRPPDGNETNEEERSEFKRNRTFNANGVLRSNMTASAREDTDNEMSSNGTSAVLSEDDENFQDQELWLPGLHCHQELLLPLSHSECGESFHLEMFSLRADEWCHLDSVIRPYNDLTLCLVFLSNHIGCYFPNPDIQQFFLYIHSVYFHNCTGEELVQGDAPHWLVVLLTLLPVSIIPLLVYMVAWKSGVSS